jgi:hypothetical protein
MKKQLVIIGIVVFLLTEWLTGCQSQGLRVLKISEEPKYYVNMTENQMQNFPHLKVAILTNESIEIPREEFHELSELLKSENTKFIRYQTEYYELFLWIGN